MRKNVKAFATLISETLPIGEPIYEFGSFQVPEQIGFADLRPLFKDKEYVGCDMREGPGVDKILDLHAVDLPSNFVGLVLCLDTLEHVEYPRKAINEIYRILKPDGIAVISSVMKFPIHDHPYDYWRFTPEAFKSILKPFPNSFVGYQGKEAHPHTIVGIGCKGDMPALKSFRGAYENWQKNEGKTLERIVLKLTPPILLPLIKFLSRTVTLKTGRST